MLEKILLTIVIVDLVCFGILLLLSCSKDFMTWAARKNDPEWAKEYDKHQFDFLRLKQQSGDPRWGI